MKEYLLKHGMIDTHKDNIATKGYGESKPIADNKTEKGRFEQEGRDPDSRKIANS